MLCPRCGKSIENSRRGCPSCGAGVAAAILTPPPGMSSTGRSQSDAVDAPTMAGGLDSSTMAGGTSFPAEPPTTFIAPDSATTFGDADDRTRIPGSESWTELLLARQVTHKNVVHIHDLGEIDGIKYNTMAYVNGADLATLIRKHGGQTAAKTLRIARSVVSGLVAAHGAGVVHRDLKPANI